MQTGNIEKEMQFFKSSVNKLSSKIGRASTLWSDEKFSELSASVAEVAKDSKKVMLAGKRCTTSLQKFIKIANEKY